jgi:adenosine deaminase
MCILRDSPVQDAMPTYKAMLPWGSMVVGIGLDSDELDRPPSLFYDVFQRARADGFKITSHCDFNQKNTHEHIRQCAEELSGKGADRIDHGMNAADKPELMKLIKEKDIGLTLSPCGYIRHSSEADVFSRIRKLFDAGIKIAIASDDPAYMEDNWILHNTYLVKEKCGFSNAELLQLQRNGVAICWWDEVSRASFSTELLNFEATFS